MKRSGVKEYWVVFPVERTMLIYTLVEGKFVSSRPMVDGDVITSSVLPGFSMDLKEMFGEEEEV
jgi:Uma2 family endonuclease